MSRCRTENLVLLGRSGTGKSHHAEAISHAAISELIIAEDIGQLQAGEDEAEAP